MTNEEKIKEIREWIYQHKCSAHYRNIKIKPQDAEVWTAKQFDYVIENLEKILDNSQEEEPAPDKYYTILERQIERLRRRIVRLEQYKQDIPSAYEIYAKGEWGKATMKCEHDKAYNTVMLLTDPPQRRWICRKCGEEGIDTMKTINQMEYLELKERFGKTQ